MTTFSRRQGEGAVARRNLVVGGPLLPVAVGPADFPPGSSGIASIAGESLPDTGAITSVLDLGVLQSLGLAPTGYQRIASPTGVAARPSFSARIVFPDLSFRAFAFNDFIGTDLAALGVVAIIGRSILADFVFTYDGPEGRYSITG